MRDSHWPSVLRIGLRAGLGATLVVGVSSCAGGAAASEETAYVNEADCAATVSRHRDDPGRRVDTPPVPLRMTMAPASPSRDVAVRFVVDEAGRVVPGSVVAVDAALDDDLLRAMGRGWRFRPARTGTCWVPASYEYVISGGE